jgi:hypothetical protein
MARGDEDLASIDDLLAGPLTGEIEPAPVVPPEPGGFRSAALRWLFWTTLVAGIASAAVWLIAYAFGYSFPYLLVFAVFFALVALRRSVTALGAPQRVVGAPPTVTDASEIEPPPDGLHLALTRWDSRLSQSRRDADRYARMVRPRLVEIADERLRQRHGVTRAIDPDRAREIMGENLWTFLVTPSGRSPNPRELAAVVKDMEKL